MPKKTLVKSDVEEIKEQSEKDISAVSTDFLLEIDVLKKKHLEEIEMLKEYTSTPNIESIKEVGRWFLFGAVSFLVTWGIEALIPSLEIDVNTKSYLILGLTSLQRYLDKFIHENYLKVKAENAVARAINFVEGKTVVEAKKLPIRGIAPF